MICSTTWGNISETNTINVNYEDLDDYDVDDEDCENSIAKEIKSKKNIIMNY